MKKWILPVTLVVIAIIIISVTVPIYVISDEDKDEKPIFVKIFADKQVGYLPLKINFTSFVTDYDGELKYQWDFGDGNTSTEQNPTKTYTGNQSYKCSLQVTDGNGKKNSDSVIISSKENHKPTVSIEFETKYPRRPKNFILEFVLPMIFHIDTFDAEDFRDLRDIGFLNPFFKGMESSYILEASASDEDGDDIVSYNWTLRPPPYTTRFGNRPKDPKYTYSGQKIEIPWIDIYPSQLYSITVTVTDSAGKNRSETLDFKVQKSHEKDRIESTKIMLTNAINKWISQWSTSFIAPFVFFIVGLIFSKFVKDLPLIQLSLMIGILLILQTEPKDYSEYENLMGPLKELTDKRQWAYNFVNKGSLWLQEKNPGLANNFSTFFGAKDMEDFREILGFENKRPIISNPSPQNKAEFVDLNTSNVWISVNDPEGDRFNVCIYGDYINTSGNHYVNYTNVNNSDGPFSAPLMIPLPSSGQEKTYIEWHVKVVDPNYSDEVVKASYKFSTAYE